MANKTRIPITAEEACYVQMLDYEVSAYKNLIRVAMICSNENQLCSNEKFKETRDLYIQKSKELRLMEEDLRANYIPDEYKTSKFNMTISFAEECIIISTIDEGRGCGCV